MSTKNFYILHGDDDIAIDEAVSKFRAEMGGDINAEMNITEFDGSTATVPEILNAVSSFPFLSDRRLAIVKGLIGWITRKGAGKTGKEAVQRLQEALPELPDHARLVLVERGGAISDKNAVMKFATKMDNGFVRAFNAPKDTVSWILHRAEKIYEIPMDKRAAVALSAVTGTDLRLADNELVKLVAYTAGENRPISEDDVATLTPYVPEANIFALTDAIATGRGEQALELMHRLLSDKNQDPFSIFGMIVRQFRLLLLAKEHFITKGNRDGLASALGVHAYPAQKAAQQAQAFSLEDLERIYRNLAELDLKIKTGRIDMLLALDLFITGVSR